MVTKGIQKMDKSIFELMIRKKKTDFRPNKLLKNFSFCKNSKSK